MCLDTVDKKPKQVTEGWKIFNIKNYSIKRLFFNEFKFKINKWVRDTKYYNIKTYNTNNEIYKTGFHFFLNKKDAKYWIYKSKYNWKIYKVRVSNVVATGIQDSCEVGVAREIFIEGE